MNDVPTTNSSAEDASSVRNGTVSGPDTAPSVAIVILTWENYDEIVECLDSIQSITYPNYRVIVVDNGSEDGSIERLQSEYDWCEFVLNEENEGFARGNNAGISYALESGAEYVLLLNDDTIVSETFLEPLVETMETYDSVAAVGGVNLHADSGKIHNAGYIFHPWIAAKGELYREPKASEPYPVDYVQSCLVLLNPEFLDEIGLLNESYFLGMEDVDLAWKAKKNGWKVLTAPDSRIRHRVGETATRSPFSSYHKIRNKLQFGAENLSLPCRIPLYLSLIAETLSLFLWWSVTGGFNKIRTTVLGAYDHFRDAEFRDYDRLTN
ncbi:glycosyltransferase family 2 protein [Haloarcula sp. S1AR25-5A]|uniref:Glycosyltransferase family 2 protein n=1 Tax=Haloarcula terrestris TaxID=2950533 RepID=A0AAE4EYT0_9EURY|nr:glycosyltransferase family 2 protein [Haloarcula terrestris]MDS0222701.1 glycosyltransferase family 2 protein [Haloarcula terrestris]